MADSSSSPPVSLELLIHEIEAMPREYWTELLDALRQFREKIPSTTPPVINAEQAKKNQAAIDLLDSWLSETEDASEHQQAWDFLKTALDEPKAGSPRFCPPPGREKDGAIKTINFYLLYSDCWRMPTATDPSSSRPDDNRMIHPQSDYRSSTHYR